MPFHPIALVFSIFTPPPHIPDNELSNEMAFKNIYIFAKMTTFIFIILFAHLWQNY